MNRRMQLLEARLPAAIAVGLALLLSGCPEIGFVGTKDQTFRGGDSLSIQNPRSDILDIVAEVGKNLGYNVSALNRDANTISLSSSSSNFSALMIGKISQTRLDISLTDGGKKLEILGSVHGNFGTGGQTAAMKLIDKFKAKLSERLGQ